ncbi:MAG TPA: glycosyltransferase family 39 protein [Anaerolineae bacterium]|nr:glycosyltransferase family 39 protein [Anaerolineae bacterium]
MIAPSKANRGLIIILALFLILGTAYSALIPIFEISDEISHYPMVHYVATERALPVQPLEPGVEVGPWRQEASQPPLYYMLAAALTSWIDTSDFEQVYNINPQAASGLITPDRHNVNLVLHNPTAERFPWRGTVLAVHVARFFSVLLGVWAVALSWRLIRALFPARPRLALAVAATHAFTPMFVFISSSVNNDALVIPLSILALLLMVRMLKQESDFPGAELRLGLAIGLAILSKESALALLPLAAATSLWATWQRLDRPARPTWACALAFAKSLLTWMIPAALLAGWWYVRNARLYGDPLGLNAFLNVAGGRPFTPTLADLWGERFSFMAAYWGNFGGLNVPMPRWIYHALNGVVVVAGLSLLWCLLLWLREEKPLWRRLWPFYWQPLTAARALAWAWPAAVFVALIRWTRMTMASQGRLVFPALPLWSLGLIGGLLTWVPSQRVRLARATMAAIPTVVLTLTVVALPAWILPSYRPPEPLPDGFTPPQTLDVTFGQHLHLLGYRIATEKVEPGNYVELDLYWESLAPTESEYLLFIHLLGEGDRIVAQRDTPPGRGLLSTTRLTPGRTWAEHLAIRIPPQAYAPDTLSVSVGVYNATTGARLHTPAGDDHTRFGEVRLVATEGDVPNPIQIRFGKGMLLRGYDVSALSVAAGEPLTVTLHWEGRASMERDYTVSVQLIDGQWRKAAQWDAWPLDGAAPTSTWWQGQTLEETRVLTVTEDAIPGVYDLRLAVYSAQEGRIAHLPVRQERYQTAETHVVLTRVRVTEGR